MSSMIDGVPETTDSVQEILGEQHRVYMQSRDLINSGLVHGGSDSPELMRSPYVPMAFTTKSPPAQGRQFLR